MTFYGELLKLQVVLVWNCSSFEIWMDPTLLSKNDKMQHRPLSVNSQEVHASPHSWIPLS